MFRKTVFAASLSAFALSVAGCNAVQGLGKDIESVGQKGEEVITHAPAETDEQNTQFGR